MNNELELQTHLYKMKPFVESNRTTYRKKVGYYNSVWFSIERFLDRHNHLMEFIRTLLALIVLTLQFYILSRL